MKSPNSLFQLQAFPRLRAGDVIIVGLVVFMAAGMFGVYGALRSPDAPPDEIHRADMTWTYASLIMDIGLLFTVFGIFLAVFRRIANAKNEYRKNGN